MSGSSMILSIYDIEFFHDKVSLAEVLRPRWILYASRIFLSISLLKTSSRKHMQVYSGDRCRNYGGMMMADRFRYAQVRQMIIDAMKVDLMGPQSEDEVLDENPRHAYIIGLLAPQTEAGADAADGNDQSLKRISITRMTIISLPERMMITNPLSPPGSSCPIPSASAFTWLPGQIPSAWMLSGATIRRQLKSVLTKVDGNAAMLHLCVTR